MSINRGPSIVTDGLVFCVDAASKRSYSGGSGWVDLAGNNDGTLTNGPAFSSDNGGCIVLDGSDDKIIHSSDPSLTFGNGSTDNPFSFFAWVYMNTLNTPCVGGKYRSYSPYRGEYTLGIDDSAKLNFQTLDRSGGLIRCRQIADAALVVDRWYYVGATYNASGADEGIILYVDGLVIPSTGGGEDGSYVAMQQAGDPSEFSLGSYLDEGNDNFARYLNGKIAAAQIYNKVLTANEVRQNYLATKGRFGL